MNRTYFEQPYIRQGPFLYNYPPKGNTKSVEVAGLTQRGFEVRWSANDPDGNAITYHVQISTDEGKTWETKKFSFSLGAAGRSIYLQEKDRDIFKSSHPQILIHLTIN